MKEGPDHHEGADAGDGEAKLLGEVAGDGRDEQRIRLMQRARASARGQRRLVARTARATRMRWGGTRVRKRTS